MSVVTPQTKYAPDSCQIGGNLNESFQLSDSRGGDEADMVLESFLSLVMSATSLMKATSGSAKSWMTNHITIQAVLSIRAIVGLIGAFSRPSGISPISSGLSLSMIAASGSASTSTNAPSNIQATRQCAHRIRDAANGVSIRPPHGRSSRAHAQHDSATPGRTTWRVPRAPSPAIRRWTQWTLPIRR